MSVVLEMCLYVTFGIICKNENVIEIRMNGVGEIININNKEQGS